MKYHIGNEFTLYVTKYIPDFGRCLLLVSGCNDIELQFVYEYHVFIPEKNHCEMFRMRTEYARLLPEEYIPSLENLQGEALDKALAYLRDYIRTADRAIYQSLVMPNDIEVTKASNLTLVQQHIDGKFTKELRIIAQNSKVSSLRIFLSNITNISILKRVEESSAFK